MENKNGLVIADSVPIFSLVIADKLELLETLFDVVRIPEAVWNEITRDTTTAYFQKIFSFFQGKTLKISGFNELSFIMDYGEIEQLKPIFETLLNNKRYYSIGLLNTILERCNEEKIS